MSRDQTTFDNITIIVKRTGLVISELTHQSIIVVNPIGVYK